MMLGGGFTSKEEAGKAPSREYSPTLKGPKFMWTLEKETKGWGIGEKNWE